MLAVITKSPSEGKPGLISPLRATLIGGVDGGGVMRPISVDSLGNLGSGSIGLTNTQLRAAPVPVSGTFWQTIQQVYVTNTASDIPALLLFKDLGVNITLNVKASTGNVYSLACFHNGLATKPPRYIQLHDTATVPAGGAAPVFSFMVPANSQTIIGTDFFSNQGAYFSTGIAFAFSTTINTYTAGVASEQTTFITYG